MKSTGEPQNILYSEVEEAIRTVKRNKRSGPDRIAAETHVKKFD